MRRNRSVFEAVLILVASGTLLMTGGVANAVALKSGPKSAPNSAPQSAPHGGPKSAPDWCKPFVPKGPKDFKPRDNKGPVGNQSAPKTSVFALSSTAPKSARVGDVVVITATFTNKGAAGYYGFSTSAIFACGGGYGDGFGAYVATGETVTLTLTIDTTYALPGKVDIEQSVFEMTTFSRVAYKQTGSFKLVG